MNQYLYNLNINKLFFFNQDDPEYELTEDTVNDMKELFLMFDTDQVISLLWRVFLLFMAVHKRGS